MQFLAFGQKGVAHKGRCAITVSAYRDECFCFVFRAVPAAVCGELRQRRIATGVGLDDACVVRVLRWQVAPLILKAHVRGLAQDVPNSFTI